MLCSYVPIVAHDSAYHTSVGILKRIDGVEEARSIPGVEEISIVHNIGENIGEIGSSIDRIGFVIAQGECSEEAVGICEQVCDKVNIISE